MANKRYRLVDGSLPELRNALHDVAERLATLEGQSDRTPTFRSNVDMQGKRVGGAGKARADDEYVTRGELAEQGVYLRSGERSHNFRHTITVPKVVVPSGAQDLVDAPNLAQVEALVRLIVGSILSVGFSVAFQEVANIANPSSELATLTADNDGSILVVFEANAAANDSFTLYLWDTDAAAVNVPYVVAGDGGRWVAVGGRYSALSFALDSLTASRLVAADASKNIASVAALTAWVAGTANQVTVTDDGDGSITLSTPGTTTTATVVTNVRDNAGSIEAKTRLFTLNGGVVTTVGAESGWTATPLP